MNESRRKDLAKALSLIEEAKDLIEKCATAERDQFDEMTEKAQESGIGQEVEAAATTLEEALESCDELISTLNF